MLPITSQPRVIPLSRWKILLLTLGGWAFVALGVWLWTISDVQKRNHPLFVKAVAVVAVSFFGLCGGYGCVKIFDRRPGLIIDSEGIVDNASALAAGRVPWDDITAIQVSEISNQQFLTITVTDPAKYLERGNAFTRFLSGANIHLTGSPINISASALAICFDELHATLLTAFRQHKIGD